MGYSRDMRGPIFIALGGNLPSQAGSPQATQTAALKRLGELGVRLVRQSSAYATAPVPVSDQPWFVNAVAEVATAHSPADLLAILHGVEATFGRARSVANAARTVD